MPGTSPDTVVLVGLFMQAATSCPLETREIYFSQSAGLRPTAIMPPLISSSWRPSATS
jgi:hypothetical protein